MGLTQSALGRSRRRGRRQSREPFFLVDYDDSQSLEEGEKDPAPSEIWDFTDKRLPSAANWALKIFLKTLCLISFGHPSLQPVYEICLAQGTVWQESTEKLYDRLNTIVVVVSIIYHHKLAVN